jgi:tryptophanyl-tRNA synthetase
LTGELKKMAIDLITQYVVEFQVRRSDVTDAVVRQFMTPRKLEWKGNPNPKPRPKVEPPTPAEGKSKKSKKGKKGDTNANHTVQSQGGAENSAANPAAPETVAKS